MVSRADPGRGPGPASGGEGAVVDAELAQRAWRIALLEREVLALLAENQPVERALDELARGLERIAAPGTLASILIVDDNGTLRHGAAPNLPRAYVASIEGASIGPAAGSCGTAAWERATVIVTDIENDPRWAPYRGMALEHGLRACWSMPILSTQGLVLGTFAFYYRDCRAPRDEDLAAIEGAARLARIVLERERADRARGRASRRERALFAAARVLAEATDVHSALRDVLGAVGTALGWSCGAAWQRDGDQRDLVCVAAWSSDASFEGFMAETRGRRFAPGRGLPGRVHLYGEAEWVAIRADDPTFPRWRSASEAGLTDGFAFPVVADGEVLGVLELFTAKPEPADPDLLVALRTVGLQVGQFVRRARAQAERERLIAELRDTVRFSELLAAILAHDLRNPLATIVVGTQLLQASPLDERGRAALEHMSASETRMSRMIDQLLDLTRSRSGGGLAVTRAPFDLGTLARSIASELAVAHPHRVVAVEIEGDAHGEWDQDRLGQVLSNLIGNAIEHGDDATPVHVAVDGTDPAEVTLSTHNVGTIAAEHLASLFDPFRRATEASRGTGLGLGLHITRLIAEAHGGSVSVTSDQDGTTFRVRLPRTADAPAEPGP